MNQKTSPEIEMQNPMGKTGHMLVVYHPGLSAFPRTIMSKFVEGAISRDWKATISIFSDQSPKDLSGYDIVAFLSPGYGGVPQKDFTNMSYR